MTKSLIALAFAALSGMLLVATPDVAQGQSLTITGFTCTGGWTFSGTTLTCGGGSGPTSCTISGNVNGTTSVVDTLTANCSPAATQWSWTGGSCAGVITQTCAANEGATGPVTYTVTGTGAGGTAGASPGYVVQWYSTTGAPQGCAISPATQSMGSSGGPIGKLTVACAGGAPLTSFVWSVSGTCNPSFVPSGASTQNDSLPANASTTTAATCTYKATVDNGSGTPQAPTATVTVAAAAGTIDCMLGGVPNKTLVQNIPWVTDSGITPTGSAYGLPDLRTGWAYVGVIKVPANANPSATAIGRADVFEYGDNAHRRWVTLSPSACTWVVPGPVGTAYQNEPTVRFTVGPNTNMSYMQLTPGQTYYLNIKMVDPYSGGGQCGSGTCNLNVEFHNGL